MKAKAEYLVRVRGNAVVPGRGGNLVACEIRSMRKDGKTVLIAVGDRLIVTEKANLITPREFNNPIFVMTEMYDRRKNKMLSAFTHEAPVSNNA